MAQEITLTRTLTDKLQNNMHLEPKDLFEKLEFDKVLDLVEKQCLGELGRIRIQEVQPVTDLHLIRGLLQEVFEFKLTIENNDRFPITSYEEISEDLRMLEVDNFVLPEEGLRRINIILRFIQAIFQFFTPGRRETYSALYHIIKDLEFDKSLIDAIEKVIDEEGNIKPDASPELLSLRRKKISKQKELEKQFRSIIQQYRSKGWLTDNVESFRNGRRVLSVPAEHKRKIRGIIHDESATGKTSFIEPEQIIAINNDIFDLENEEKREIYRILRRLSGILRPYVPLMHAYQEILINMDTIQAKARIALQMEATLPKIIDQPHLGIIQGYHPLLFLKNKRLEKHTVPFDLTLLHGNRMLVLSGPNAGGKSITMKSIGLLQLMLQSGMLIPVHAASEMGIFKKIFADIGDQQSLEDDLSTYSSRLKNMRIFLENADKDTLVLIDEFGSGTDPQIGGAIAEAILKELNQNKVFGILTTHYSNLKIFAFKTKGIINASMTFDKDNLTPTYEFKVGRPGSSYAFEVAQKSGLGKKVLKYAKHRTGKNEKAVDQLLIELQRDKQELSEQLEEMANKEKKLEKLIRNYEQLHKDLEFKRKKFKLESKEKALQQQQSNNKVLEKLVREIKEEKNLEKAKEVAQKVREDRKELIEEVTNLKEEVYYKPENKPILKKGKIEVGDHVKLISGGSTGTVESLVKNKAVVQMGLMRMTVNLRDLQHANAPLDVQSNKSVQMDTVSHNTEFQSKIDIRGMRLEEALKVVEEFVDQALITNSHALRIIHGKGNGVLRKAVKSKLREYDVRMEVRHPEAEQGGDGVTLIDIQ